MNHNKFLVCTRCFTFNHAPYVKDAMDGFCMQQTNFPYVCTIVDDCSTDCEQEVIKDYLHMHFDLEDKNVVRNEETEDYVLTFAQHRTNPNCYFAVFLLKYNHYSKPEKKNSKFRYIAEWRENVKYNAFCEGDDYWIDPLKLQKQVDFLDSHPDYGMCYTDFNIEDTVNNKSYNALFANDKTRYPVVRDFEQWIINYYYTAPMSWLVRKELMADMPEIKSSDGTFVYFAYFLYASKVYFQKDVTSVYRRVSESASNTLSPMKIFAREESMYRAKIELANRYLPPKRKEEVVSIIERNYYSMCLKLFVAVGRYDQIEKAKLLLSGGDSMLQKLLLNYPRNKFATKLFYILYKNIIQIRKKIYCKV